jgi:predicted alpha/beta superfamily hydrolase
MGAFISLYIAFKHFDVFSRAGLFSPAFWFARSAVMDFIGDTKISRSLRVYMDVGTNEAGDPSREYLESAKAVDALFSQKAGLERQFIIDQGGVHHESAWARRFPTAFLWLFGR